MESSPFKESLQSLQAWQQTRRSFPNELQNLRTDGHRTGMEDCTQSQQSANIKLQTEAIGRGTDMERDCHLFDERQVNERFVTIYSRKCIIRIRLHEGIATAKI